MSHQLYQTEGLILGHRHYGEANSFYQILTPDLGLIGASAQGVRQLQSKLNPHLRDLDYVNLTLVRGREVWRLTGVETKQKLGSILGEVEKRRVWARMASLIRRLIQGEQAQPELFFDLLSGLEKLGRVGSAELTSVELVIVLRLLYQLGYVQKTAELSPWLAPDFWSVSAPALVAPESGQIITVINHSLAHSQL